MFPRTPGVLIRVEGLAPADFKVTAIQPNYSMQNGSVELEKKSIKPFTDEAITFTVQATKPGVFNLNPATNLHRRFGRNQNLQSNPGQRNCSASLKYLQRGKYNDRRRKTA